VCSSIGVNENTTNSDDEEITLRPVEDSMVTYMALDIFGNSYSTFGIEENDLDERIFLRNRLISALK